jgi:hypothetical protein
LEKVGGPLDELFKDFIEGLDIQLSDKGLEVPELERMSEDNLPGHVLKFTIETYLFMDHARVKYYMLSNNQKMQDMGEMTLKDTIAKYGKLKPPPKKNQG